MKNSKKLLSLFVAMAVSSTLFAGELRINTDMSDPAPKKAFAELIKDFEAKYPDIKVNVNTIDHEGYKTSIRNFLSADAPDLANWFAGNRMKPYVEAGLFEPVNDVWKENGLYKTLAPAKDAMTIDGKVWGIPYTYYQWGVFYRKDIFKKNGITEPKTWEEFLVACKKLKAAGVTPITIGTKYLWTAAGIFDFLNLRTNGYEYHMKLTSGEIPWTDKGVRKTFENWKTLIDMGAFIDNHAAYSWQEALAPMVQGKAAMYVMGNFAVAPLREAGLDKDKLGFFQFPVINPNIVGAEEAPTDTMHIPANAKNKEDAKKFLAFLAQADTQTKLNKALGQLPINVNSQAGDDEFLQAGFKMLSNTKGGISQFFDRDAPAAMAKPAMESFQEFMVKPKRLESILKRLDRIQKKINKKASKK